MEDNAEREYISFNRNLIAILIEYFRGNEARCPAMPEHKVPSLPRSRKPEINDHGSVIHIIDDNVLRF